MASRKHATRLQPVRTGKADSSQGHRASGLVLKVMAGIVVAGVIYGIFLGVEQLMVRVNAQHVELVRIEGELKQVDQELIQTIVSVWAGQPFMGIDLERVKDDLKATPWIRDVSVKREWPDTLIVHVVEQQAIARWNNKAFLNSYGEVFYPQNIQSLFGLPLLEGPVGHENEVMQQYQKFSQVLMPHGLRMSALSLTPRGAWNMQLENGVKVNIGKTDVVERLQRFTRMLEGNLFQGFLNIESVDLRYRNGMAIRHVNKTEDIRISSR